MTFSSWLSKQKKRNDPVGDFARDWCSDTGRGKPRGAYGWGAVERYLERVDACAMAEAAAERAWQEWQHEQA